MFLILTNWFQTIAICDMKYRKRLIFLVVFVLTFFVSNKPVFAAVTFKGGFEDNVFQYPNTFNNWHDARPGMTYSYWDTRLTRVNNPVRSGSWALKAEVRPGDSYGSSGERAEVYWMYGADGKHIVENETSGTQYYAISVYIPADFIPPSCSGVTNGCSSWAIIEQLHGADVYSAPPVFAIGAKDNYYVQMWSGDLDYLNDSTKSHKLKYSLGDLQKGKWVDFVWKIKYSKNFTGSVDVWRRIEGEQDFSKVLNLANIPTLQFKTSVNNGAILDAYWRSGYYTSQENFTRIIYLDSHARGDSFNEIVSYAFPITVFNTSDLNTDGEVDILDYNILTFDFGNPYTVFDFNKLITNFGR